MVTQRYFATLLPFPLARRSNYHHGSCLEAARNGQAGRQTGYLSSHRSLDSEEVFHWTETQEPFQQHQSDQEEEFLAKAKILNLKVNFFCYFIRMMNARVESRENWTQAQNGRLDWPGDWEFYSVSFM